MMDILPRIMDYVVQLPLKEFRFIKPSTQNGVTPLLEEDASSSLSTVQLGLRMLTLPGKVIVPFHYHRQKEKVYRAEYDRDRALEILIAMRGAINRYNLKKAGDLVTVPKNRPHALIYHDINPDRFLVITSSQDASCEWEPETASLILNTHL